MAASVDVTKTSEAGIQACVSFINWKSDFRSDRDLVESWARNSQEALAWWADAAAEGGVESQPYDTVLNYNGYDIYLHANTYFHCAGAHNDAAQVICQQEQEAGCDFYFNTPAVQLQTDESGRVTGVIGTDADGNNVLLTASKGVIMCTGDYSGNKEMREYYCPDIRGFNDSVMLRDGSGYAMGMWAGAVLVPPTHTKMIHGEGSPVRLEMPFLFLDTTGHRFMDENCGGRMGYLNNYGRKYIAQTGFTNSNAPRSGRSCPTTGRTTWRTGRRPTPTRFRRTTPTATSTPAPGCRPTPGGSGRSHQRLHRRERVGRGAHRPADPGGRGDALQRAVRQGRG